MHASCVRSRATYHRILRSSPPFTQQTGAGCSIRFAAPRRSYSAKPPLTDAGKSHLTRLEQLPDYISSLAPSRLTEMDFIDLSRRSDVHVSTPNIPREDGIVPTYRLRYTDRVAWPPGTSGFLYLKRAEVGAPVTTSSLRFRITNNTNPKSFERGEDLKLCGLPWETPLIYTKFSLFEYMFKQDRSFSPQALDRMKRLSAYVNIKNPEDSRWNDPYTPLIYTLSQPFHFDFTRSKVRFWLLKAAKGRNPEVLSQMWFPTPTIKLNLREQRSLVEGSERLKSQYFPLYRGSAIVRFERPESDDDTRIAIRVLKIVEPVVPNGNVPLDLPPIQEGSYVPIVDPSTRTIQNAQGPFDPAHPQYILANLLDWPLHPDVASSSYGDWQYM